MASENANEKAKENANEKTKEKEKLDPRRMEFGGLPIIAGNTDIGIQFGAAATITKFYDDAAPYLWNIDVLLSASLKSDSEGTRFIQQSHLLRIDAPALLGGMLRVDSRLSFERTVNAGYYGIGNATSELPAAGQTFAGNHFQFLFEEAKSRTITRWKVGWPVDLLFGAIARYELPTVYDQSALAADGALVRGTQPTFLGTLSAGLAYDTRDSEFITHRGLYYQVGIGATVGSSLEGIHYGEAAAVLAHYLPLGDSIVLAERVVASFQFGEVPFYDLASGGVFEPQRLFGGENGVRGVPEGRYAGMIKAVSNTELRGTGPRFSLLKQRLRIGASIFVDVGRAWADWSFASPRDGSGVGLKYGIGAGLLLQWGEAAIFRLDVAYSPDAVAENPGLPVGIYVSDGLAF